MNITEMVLIVLTISQALKEFLRKWIAIQGTASVILAVIVTCGVVGYKFSTEGLPFEIGGFISMVVSVASIAIGGKLTASSIVKKANTKMKLT